MPEEHFMHLTDYLRIQKDKHNYLTEIT